MLVVLDGGASRSQMVCVDRGARLERVCGCAGRRLTRSGVQERIMGHRKKKKKQRKEERDWDDIYDEVAV